MIRSSHPSSSRTATAAALAIVACAAMTACTVGPDYHAPQMTVKNAWADATAEITTQPASAQPTTSPATKPALQVGKAVDTQWWKQFDDPHLNTLIDQAMKSSPDLVIAANRVLEARAQSAVTASGQYPSANLGGTYDYYHRAGPLAATIPGDYQWYQVGFDASWEIDVFGGIRRSVESSTATYQASIEEARGVRLTLISEVVRNYVDLRAAQRRLLIARRNLEYQQNTLKITRERLAAGVVGELDVSRAEALVAQTSSTIPPLQDKASEAVRSLGVLLGQDPDQFSGLLQTDEPIPPAPGSLAVGLPGDLLRRRPDIRAAERQLAAANAQIGEATANLYPRFALLGGIGQLDVETQHFFDWSRHYAAIGPEMSWDIFDAGRTNAQINSQKAATAAALARYQKTVLSALAEVENAMTSLNSERERHAALADAVDANRKSVATASQLYIQGVTDFITVLDSERSLAASEDALAASEQAIDIQVVALCNALGGGWESTEPPPSAAIASTSR
ncbi:MAG TPA: efflux transporter outer membrane subunit [Phycisphaerae bacterium]|nr:efflux transporter outer membrane subunit [Phycisphaerae bacterium]